MTRDSAAAVAQRPFLTCGSCRTTWERWEDCIRDPRLRLLGMQAVPRLPEANLIVFEHVCGSSVSVLASRLRFLIDEPELSDMPELRGSEECRKHCLTLEDLHACDRPCINARDRRLARRVAEIKQTGTIVTKRRKEP